MQPGSVATSQRERSGELVAAALLQNFAQDWYRRISLRASYRASQGEDV